MSYSIIEDVLGEENPKYAAYHRNSNDRYHDVIQAAKIAARQREHQMNHAHKKDDDDEDGGIVPENYNVFNDGMNCRDVVNHVENCPLCNSHFKKDLKFYWFVIVILIIILAVMCRKHLK